MEMKGNVVAFPSIYFVWVGLVLSSLLFRLQYSTVLSVPTVGRSPTVLLSGSHTLAPIGRTALRACATGSHPKVTPRDGSPSPRAGHIDRTHSHGRARANVPWDVRDPHGTAHHGTARERAHTPPASPLRPAPRPSTRPTCLRCRPPLLTASACHARAQHKLQPTKPLLSSDWAGCDGVGHRPRRKLARAHCCCFSAAAFCSHHLGRANDTMDSSTTIDSRRKALL